MEQRSSCGRDGLIQTPWDQSGYGSRLAGKITITQTWLFMGTIYSPKHTKMIRFLFIFDPENGPTYRMNHFADSLNIFSYDPSVFSMNSWLNIMFRLASRWWMGFQALILCIVDTCVMYTYIITVYMYIIYILQPASQRYYLFLDISRHCHALAASSTNIMIHYVHCQAISTMAAHPWGTTR